MMKDNQDIWKKEFDELNAQEREYVSEWCETPEDYGMVRNFMLQMSKVDKQPVEPSKELKDQLMAEFPSTERKRGIWLNLWLMIFPEEGGMNWKPIMAAALLIGVIVTIVFIQNPFSENKKQQMAENQVKEKSEKRSEDNNESRTKDESELEDLEAESLKSLEEESEQAPKTTETLEINEERSNIDMESDEETTATKDVSFSNNQAFMSSRDETSDLGYGEDNLNIDDIDVSNDSEIQAKEMSPKEDQLKKQSDFKISESDKDEIAENEAIEEVKEKKDFSFFNSSRREKSKSSAPLFGGNKGEAAGNAPAASKQEAVGNSSVLQVNNAQKNKDLNALHFATY